MVKCEKCDQEVKEQKTEWVKIPELGIEVEQEYHFKDILIKDIKIPKRMRLLTISEWLVCYNKHKSKFIDLNKDSDEIIEQPVDEIKNVYPYWNVWLFGLVDQSVLYGGNRVLDCGSQVRGVRFCRDLKKVKDGK